MKGGNPAPTNLQGGAAAHYRTAMSVRGESLRSRSSPREQSSTLARARPSLVWSGDYAGGVRQARPGIRGQAAGRLAEQAAGQLDEQQAQEQ